MHGPEQRHNVLEAGTSWEACPFDSHRRVRRSDPRIELSVRPRTVFPCRRPIGSPTSVLAILMCPELYRYMVKIELERVA